MIDTRDITRLEIIDHRKDAKEQGRAFVANNVKIKLSSQDDGKTLKVFINKRKKDV